MTMPLDSYLSSVRNNYKADAVSLDFNDRIGSAKAVNSFVSDVTHGKIGQIVSPITFHGWLRVLLVNALYMNAKWAHEFYSSSNFWGPFFVSPTIEKEVNYLSHQEVYRDYYENSQYQLLSLEYKDTRYRFNVYLPKEKYGLADLQTNFIGTGGQLRNTLLNINIPKFKLETQVDLAALLKTLGVRKIFSPSADLSGFDGKDGLLVSDAIHKATIEVNEEGTVAAAVTAYRGKLLAAPFDFKPKPIDFIADHPFMFCITFNNHPVFIGKYY